MRYLLFLILLMSTLCRAAAMEVRYYDRGAKDARHAYKFELIRAILESTRTEYGEYTIIPFAEEPSAKRQSLLISEGKILNLLWAAPGTAIATGDVITVPVDILRGLLGFRVCLINPAYFPAGPIQSLDQLQIGQGLNWADVEVYKFNGITPKQGPTFESLFEMLAAKRYHCLPLGADEAMYTWREKKAFYPFLTLEPDLLIYYDYPIYLHVSKQFPQLAKRIALGLKKLQANGEFERLFNRHHAADVAALHLARRKVFCLRSPYIIDSHQCEKTLVYPRLSYE
ncbi:MAG TPA: hypothetical protein VIM59_05725 [Cellvibrio sp.]